MIISYDCADYFQVYKNLVDVGGSIKRGLKTISQVIELKKRSHVDFASDEFNTKMNNQSKVFKICCLKY